MEMKKYKLGEIAHFVDDKISSDEISLNEYITTDCLLQNKKGRAIAANLPPQSCSLTKFKKGDVLIGNIRPYLKKIWLADIDGACSLDVLALRAKNEDESAYLYSLLMQDNFYDFVMKATKGSKMPRGDKNHILTFPCFDIPHKTKIGNFIKFLDDKIALNRRMNAKLEQMAKRLYDYWFVQFNFPFDFAQGKPNTNGKPYKASGGKMVWNEVLKREIPVGWENTTLGELCEMYQPQTISTNKLVSDGHYRVYGANGVVGRYDKYNHDESEIAMACRGNSCGVINRTMPYSWITGNAMVIRMRNKNCCNEYIKQALFYMNIAGAISGSGQPQLTRENLNPIPCIDPLNQILYFFSNKVKPIVKMQLQLIKENDLLIKQRDRLLPLLMNGQVEME